MIRGEIGQSVNLGPPEVLLAAGQVSPSPADRAQQVIDGTSSYIRGLAGKELFAILDSVGIIELGDSPHEAVDSLEFLHKQLGGITKAVKFRMDFGEAGHDDLGKGAIFARVRTHHSQQS